MIKNLVPVGARFFLCFLIQRLGVLVETGCMGALMRGGIDARETRCIASLRVNKKIYEKRKTTDLPVGFRAVYPHH